MPSGPIGSFQIPVNAENATDLQNLSPAFPGGACVFRADTKTQWRYYPTGQAPPVGADTVVARGGGVWAEEKPTTTTALETYVNVQSFGAKGNGTTNDTSAIRDAMASLGSAGGTLYYPQGTYLYRGPLVTSAPVTHRGAGPAATILRRAAGDSDTRAIAWETAQRFGACDMRIENAVGDAVSYEARTVDVFAPRFQNLYIPVAAGQVGIRATCVAGKHIFWARFDHVGIDAGAPSAQRGIFFEDGGAGGSSIGTTWDGGYIANCQVAIDIDHAETLGFDGVSIYNNHIGIRQSGFASANYNFFDNMRFEANDIHWQLAAGPYGTRINCRVVAPAPTAGQCVDLATNTQIWGVDTTAGGFAFNRPSNYLTNLPNLDLTFVQKAIPANPPADFGTLSFAKVAGKIQLGVIFPTGVWIPIATEV